MQWRGTVLKSGSLQISITPGAALSVLWDLIKSDFAPNRAFGGALRLYTSRNNGSVQEHTRALSNILDPSQWLPGFTFPNSNGFATASASQNTPQNYTVEKVQLSNTKNELEP